MVNLNGDLLSAAKKKHPHGIAPLSWDAYVSEPLRKGATGCTNQPVLLFQYGILRYVC
jgi:hypothetical protein